MLMVLQDGHEGWRQEIRTSGSMGSEEADPGPALPDRYGAVRHPKEAPRPGLSPFG